MSENLNISTERELEQLFNLYYAPLVAFANKYTKDMDGSREIVQELFIHLFEKKETLKIEQSVKSYLYQSTRNRCLNYLKKQKVEFRQREFYRNEVFDDRVEFQDQVEQVEFESQIYQLIESLPSGCQKVFTMSRFEGMKNDEIAQQLNISKRTVETHISKALRILRDKIAEANNREDNRFFLGCLLL